MGAAPRMRFHGCGRAAATRVRAIALSLHLRGAAAREEAHRTVARITGELAGLLDQATAEAATVLRNARRSLPRTAGRARSRLHRAANEPNRPDLAGYHFRQAQGVRAFEHGAATHTSCRIRQWGQRDPGDFQGLRPAWRRNRAGLPPC